MRRFYVPASPGWVLAVVSLLMLNACHRTAQDPQPVQLPTITLSRTFEHTSTQPVKVVYAPDSLRYSLTKTRDGLTLNVELNRLRTGKDAVSVQLDSAALRPGLTGDYAVPLVDTTAPYLPNSPFWLDYTYFREVRGNGSSFFSISSERFLPGSYFSLTDYDANRQTVSGRFSFRFTSTDPLTPTGTAGWGNRDWIVTVTSEFRNLPITR